MPALRFTVHLDRPLSGATLPGRSERMYTEAEVSALRAEAYREGSDAARAFASQQLVEFRAEVQALQSGLFHKLAVAESELAAVLRDSLPALTVDLAKRLLAGFEPGPDQIAALCRDTLAQLFPERENLELVISERDAALLDDAAPGWKHEYPGLSVKVDPVLSAGDCLVRSRFGLTDARLRTKLDSLERQLLGT